MSNLYPPGKAPLVILLVALGCFSLIALVRCDLARQPEPDLVFSIFATQHGRAYEQAVRDFEHEHDVRVEVEVVNWRSLQNRVQAAFLADTPVSDMVEIQGDIGYFIRGPLDEVGFLPLDDRIAEANLRERVVESRFALWQSRGTTFALPHDVHPVVLAYRRDLVAELDLDLDAIETWDEFTEMAHRITADLDGDGIIDRYAMSLSPSGNPELTEILLPQRGVLLVGPDGRPAFNRPVTVEMIQWYIRQIAGPNPTAFYIGTGQTESKALIDGLVVFLFAPDWKSHGLYHDNPRLSGRMGLWPLPAWEPGGRRTSTWGATGLAITRRCENPDLAWKLAMKLYYTDKYLGERFADSFILPPIKSAWDDPLITQEIPFYGGQRIGQLFAELAPQTPPIYTSPYRTQTQTEFTRVITSATRYYEERGEAGWGEFIQERLDEAESRILKLLEHNEFLKEGGSREGE